MNLKGEYELLISIELPDGTFVPIDKMVKFTLNNNYDTLKYLTSYTFVKYFDSTDYGCLYTEDGVEWIRDYFIRQGYIEKDWHEIKNKEQIIKELNMFTEWSEEYINNEDKYLREVKLNVLTD